MARNKYPEITVEKILEVSQRLFLTKGYDNTTIQDIVDELGGLTRGAIYHHFKSKDEIVLAVMSSRQELMEEEMKQWLKATENLTGREQLQTILKSNLESQTARATDGIVGEYEKDAGFILTMMRDNLRIGAPLVSDIIKKGMADGSLRTQYPDQAAEVFLLLVNFWMHGTIFESDPEKLPERFHFLQFMMTSIGMDIFDDELMQLFIQKNKA